MKLPVYSYLCIFIGFVADLIFGDPYNSWHPVRLMGKIINIEDDFVFSKKRSAAKLKLLGLLFSLLNISITFIIFTAIYILLYREKIIFIIFFSYISYKMISAKCLSYEAEKIYYALSEGINKARESLKYIVGRDTDSLNEEEIIKATVETVAENTSDGVIAPLFYMFIFLPLSPVYKFINTMDSMWGYRNEKYRDFGYFPAKIDDIFNIIPARVTAILFFLSNFYNKNIRHALKVFIRDRYNHKSPNSGFPESVVSGLLGVRLGGPNKYFSKIVYKPYIGDNINIVEKHMIIETVHFMYKAEILFLVLSFATFKGKYIIELLEKTFNIW